MTNPTCTLHDDHHCMHALASSEYNTLHAFGCTCARTHLRTPVCENDLRTLILARADYHCMHEPVHEGYHWVNALTQILIIRTRAR